MAHENFVSTDWLAAHLGRPDLGIIDASWHLPPTGRNGAAEFRGEHIPGAVFFDIDAIADVSSGLPHMLPDARKFAAGDERAGPRRRHALRRLRRARPVRRRARLVDAARVRRRRSDDPRRRPAQMDSRRPPARKGRGATALPPLHPAAQPGLCRLDRRRAQGAGRRLGASRRRAPGRSIRGPRPRAASRPAQRPHAGKPQPAVRRHRWRTDT